MFSNQKFQLSFYSASFFGFSAILYNVLNLKKQIQAEIQMTQKARIYTVGDLKNLQKDEMFKNAIKNESGFVLIKMKPESILLRGDVSGQNKILQQKIDIYSNHIHYCPPSIDKMLDNCLKIYHKQFGRVNKVLLTDKFQWKASFTPRQKYQPNPNQAETLGNKIKNVFYIGWQILYSVRQKIWYYAQKPLQILPRNWKKKRSQDKNRSTFWKGVLAGVLTVNFNLLKDSYFLIKVRIQGSQIYTEFIAENKLMLINQQKMVIKKLNIMSAFIMVLLMYNGYGLAKILQHRFKKFWFRLTTHDKKILNPSNISDEKLCQICYLNCRNVLFYGCRHFIVCDDCYQHLQKQNCIICNLPLQKAQPLYEKPN